MRFVDLTGLVGLEVFRDGLVRAVMVLRLAGLAVRADLVEIAGVREGARCELDGSSTRQPWASRTEIMA